jgi:hypothetical protein
LKLQFGGEAYDLSRSKAANEVIQSTTFTSPTHKYTYDQHVTKFEDAYNELALLGEPVPIQSKVRLFCKSLKEKFMKAAAIDTQMSEKTGSNFEQATAHLKSIRELHITDFAKKGEERYVAELGLEPRKRKGGTAARRRAAAPEALEAFNSTATAIRSGTLSTWRLRPRSMRGVLRRRLIREPRPRLPRPSRPMWMPRKPRKAAPSSARALTPESRIGQPRQWNGRSWLSHRILLQDPILRQGHSQ